MPDAARLEAASLAPSAALADSRRYVKRHRFDSHVMHGLFVEALEYE